MSTVWIGAVIIVVDLGLAVFYVFFND